MAYCVINLTVQPKKNYHFFAEVIEGWQKFLNLTNTSQNTKKNLNLRDHEGKAIPLQAWAHP